MPFRSIKTLIAENYLRPWFVGYALIGLVVSGIVPILIPLSVDPKGAIAVGLVVAAFYLGTLTAPFFGSLADRRGAQRVLFVASFPIIAAAAIVFALVDPTWVRFLCMLVAGAAAGAAQTTASMFIVEGRPRSEWADRTGWMRLAFGTGQVIGLGVAVYFSHHLDTGWIVVGVIMAVGTVVGTFRLPKIAAAPKSTGAKAAPASPRRGGLAGLRAVLATRFGVFLAFWLFAMIGLMTFYNVVPLVLRASFGTDPSQTSLYFLIGSAVGAVLYPLCGPLCDRIGSAYVLTIGVGVTFLAFIVLAGAGAAKLPGSPIGGLCLVLIAAAYPLQYIGANLQAAELATGGEGSAMGLFNSGVAAGAIIGAIVPAFLASRIGYDALPWFSLGALVVSGCFGIPLLIKGRRHPDPATA